MHALRSAAFLDNLMLDFLFRILVKFNYLLEKLSNNDLFSISCLILIRNLHLWLTYTLR